MKPEEITKYMDAIGEGLINFANKIQKPVGVVYEMFLRQNYIKGTLAIIDIIILIVITISYIIFIFWALKKNENDYNRFEDNEGWIIVAVSWGIFIILKFSILIYGIEDIVSRFANPHYMVIKDLINFISNK